MSATSSYHLLTSRNHVTYVMGSSYNIWVDWVFGSSFCDVPGGTGPSATYRSERGIGNRITSCDLHFGGEGHDILTTTTATHSSSTSCIIFLFCSTTTTTTNNMLKEQACCRKWQQQQQKRNKQVKKQLKLATTTKEG